MYHQAVLGAQVNLLAISPHSASAAFAPCMGTDRFEVNPRSLCAELGQQESSGVPGELPHGKVSQRHEGQFSSWFGLSLNRRQREYTAVKQIDSQAKPSAIAPSTSLK